MLQSLVAWSLKHRFLVIVLAAILLVVGIHASRKARLDVFPEFAPPQVIIQTECPGLAPLDVEQLVTIPLETSVNGVPRLAKLRSQSVQGLSVITAIFLDGTDIYRARQQVAERLSELAGQLPAGVKTPRVAPLTSSTGRLLSVGFTSDKLSLLDLRDKVQWLIRPRLLIPGVAQITVMGGEVRQYQVHVNPETLAARQLTMTDVLDAVRQSSGIRGAGFVENDNQRINLRSEGQVLKIDELGEAVVTTVAGSPVRLRDVAQVVEGPEPKFGDALIDGQPGVVLTVYRQLEADTLDVTDRLEAELEKLRPVLEPRITYHPRLFRQADFIEHAVGNVAHSLWIGAALVAAVLFLFLFNLRTAFISLTAIPLSLLGAVIVLWAFGIGLNTLTLGGLAIAIGEVVDDAIIDVENIFRRLREHLAAIKAPSPPAPLPEGEGGKAEAPSPLAPLPGGEGRKSVFDVVLAASLEVRGAVVYATFVVVLVFVPIFFMSGLQGRLFAPLGLAYVLAVLTSLVVALLVTPALSLVLLPSAGTTHEPPFLRWLQAGYDRLLRGMDRVWLAGVLGMAVLLAVSVIALTQFGHAFLPELKETHFIIHARGLPGTSLPQSLAMGKTLTEKLRADDAVKHVTQLAGRAELGEDTWGVEYSEIEVPLNLERGADIRKKEQWLKETAAKTPGVSTEVFTFLSERIKELLAGTPAALAIQVHGESLESIDRTAADIASILNSVEGRVNVRVEAQTGAPEMVVRIRARDAARHGLSRVQILDAVQTAFQGAEVSQVYHGPRTIDLRVLLRAESRRDLESIKNLWLTARPLEKNAEPTRVPLHKVADVFRSDGRFLIAHEGGLRRQQVTCNVDKRDIGSFVAEVERKLADVPLPDGVFFTMTGEHEARATAQRELFFWAGIVLVGVILLLWFAYGSLGRVLLILVNLPFALVGGVLAVWLTSSVLDVGSLIGFVTLFGITTRNSMMMVSHWQHLHDEEGVPWGAELIFRGARERLAPVLMTALVTGLGLLPIAWGSGEAGREIEGPMAWVILGGLATSAVLNLLLLPVLYRRLTTEVSS
jgi:Cu/Ag efflux pump CusA